ncbi:hypothetical protein [Herminiimonas sp. CN]|uniref:hypothetical protein n=1 Tax=Herminiimonas sp. CN TaxID=1349818 RepID=UPI0004741901|nr:hypothetical protein [Herminiimonas sp. CN]
MKQFVINISETPADNTSGQPVIQFYKGNSWEAAGQLEQGCDHHENHFGCYLKTLAGKNHLAVDTVEHAEKIIEALQLAIQEGWLFTQTQIEKHKDRSTDTRGTLKRRMATTSKG